MPDTGERREISRFVDAKEQEVTRRAKSAVSKTKQQSTKAVEASQSRKRRNALQGAVEAPAQKTKKPGERK